MQPCFLPTSPTFTHAIAFCVFNISPPYSFTACCGPHLESSIHTCVWLLHHSGLNSNVSLSGVTFPSPIQSLPDPPSQFSLTSSHFISFIHSHDHYLNLFCFSAWMFFAFFLYHHHQEVSSRSEGTAYVLLTVTSLVSTEIQSALRRFFLGTDM